jgi:N6-L-threonylcarbamoyladenine synthase
MIMLGIETSCDETAVAVVSGDRQVLSHILHSQHDDHRPFGGVVPEIAARSHVERLDAMIGEAMVQAGVGFADLDGVAATAGPGLVGGVMVGLVEAKAIAAVHSLPLIAVNHLEGHALTARLTGDVAFPYLLLLVSGGHCQLLVVEDVGAYQKLGGTIDDAAGEAFDKTAKLLGLGFPGGPAVERAAINGRPDRFDLPRPMTGRDDCAFSFSGLKTAVRQTLENLSDPNDQDIADLAASFQQAVADILVERTGRAAGIFRQGWPQGRQLVVAGGVAANGVLRDALDGLAESSGLELVVPPARLCTDNGVMIAWAGIERLQRGLQDPLDVPARARWPLAA